MTEILTIVCAGLGAYFGTYLKTRGERRAIMDTLNQVERRCADISEAARHRWSRRSEVCAKLYGRLMMAAREFRNYLSPSCTSTDDAVEQLRIRAKAFDDFFAENALFIPSEIKTKLANVAEELVKVFHVTTLFRPVKAELGPEDHESISQIDIRTNHYKMKSKHRDRFKDGDLAQTIREIETDLRSCLDLDS